MVNERQSFVSFLSSERHECPTRGLCRLPTVLLQDAREFPPQPRQADGATAGASTRRQQIARSSRHSRSSTRTNHTGFRPLENPRLYWFERNPGPCAKILQLGCACTSPLRTRSIRWLWRSSDTVYTGIRRAAHTAHKRDCARQARGDRKTIICFIPV